MSEALELAVGILAGLGGGAGIVFALSKHLANLWATRTIAKERASFETLLEQLRGEIQRQLELVRVTQSRETELLIRKRDAYRGLARSLRVFQSRSDGRATAEEKNAFLAAYDDAALWASEEVVHALGAFLGHDGGCGGRTTARPPRSHSKNARVSAASMRYCYAERLWLSRHNIPASTRVVLASTVETTS